MSPASARQVITALRELDKEGGKARITQLRKNSVAVRERLSDAGFVLLGPHDSPVIPIMIVHPQKMCTFSRECLRHGLAVVIVGYPATDILGMRVRLCISAGFTDEEIDEVTTKLIDIGRTVSIDYHSGRSRPSKKEEAPADEQSQVVPFENEPIVASDAPEEREIRVLTPENMPHTVMSAFDYLGLANSNRAVEASVDVVTSYGVGSCGPRGFYGTTDKHLLLEKRLANFMHAEAAIAYSYGALTITSVLGPYVTEPTDVIVYDEDVSMAAKIGLNMIKARKYPYPHNDMKALEAIMQSVQKEERTRPRDWSKVISFDPKYPRHLLFTEGIFLNSGDVAPLPEIVALKKRYGFMLCVDETHSLCTLGSTGLGIRQYFAEKTGDMSLLEDQRSVDLIVGSLETAMGSIGGFCSGTRLLVQHQVLNGIGYVYSASTPPYLCEAACVAIDAMEDESNVKYRVEKLRENTHLLRQKCRDTSSEFFKYFDLSGNNEDSPLMFASLRSGLVKGSYADELRVLERVEDECFKNDMAVCVARFADNDSSAPKHPSIRFAVSSAQNPDVYQHVLDSIARFTAEALNH